MGANRGSLFRLSSGFGTAGRRLRSIRVNRERRGRNLAGSWLLDATNFTRAPRRLVASLRARVGASLAGPRAPRGRRCRRFSFKTAPPSAERAPFSILAALSWAGLSFLACSRTGIGTLPEDAVITSGSGGPAARRAGRAGRAGRARRARGRDLVRRRAGLPRRRSLHDRRVRRRRLSVQAARRRRRRLPAARLRRPRLQRPEPEVFPGSPGDLHGRGRQRLQRRRRLLRSRLRRRAELRLRPRARRRELQQRQGRRLRPDGRLPRRRLHRDARLRLHAERERGLRQRLRRRLRRAHRLRRSGLLRPTPSCSCQAHDEFCGNDADDDCDLLVDCADPDCTGTFPCACQPPGSPEVCTDGQDDDCDKLVDCADPSCLVSPACQSCTAEICDDGLDNNCDDKIDCADPACFFAPNCKPVPEICNNGLDDDNDTLVDCQDPDCANNADLRAAAGELPLAEAHPRHRHVHGRHHGPRERDEGRLRRRRGRGGLLLRAHEALARAPRLDRDELRLDALRAHGQVQHGQGDRLRRRQRRRAMGRGARLHASSTRAPTTCSSTATRSTRSRRRTRGPSCSTSRSTPNPPEICDDGIDNDGDVYVDCADPDCTSVGICATCLQRRPRRARVRRRRVHRRARQRLRRQDRLRGRRLQRERLLRDRVLQRRRRERQRDPRRLQLPLRHRRRLPRRIRSATRTPPSPAASRATQFFGDVCPFVAAGSYCNTTTHQCEF